MDLGEEILKTMAGSFGINSKGLIRNMPEDDPQSINLCLVVESQIKYREEQHCYYLEDVLKNKK